MIGLSSDNVIYRSFKVVRWIHNNVCIMCPSCLRPHPIPQEDVFPCQSLACRHYFTNIRSDLDWVRTHRPVELDKTIELFRLYIQSTDYKDWSITDVPRDFFDHCKQVFGKREEGKKEMWWCYAVLHFRFQLTESLHVCEAVGQVPSEIYKIVKFHTSFPSSEGTWMFHGSRQHKLISISHIGLKRLSRTKFMSTGAAHGEGVYLGREHKVSSPYTDKYYFIVAARGDIEDDTLYHHNGKICVAKDSSLLSIEYMFSI